MRPATDLRPNRDLRQRELVPPERLAACHAAVIGIGAIGRQAALQLTAVGIPLLLMTRKMTRIAVPVRMLKTGKGPARR